METLAHWFGPLHPPLTHFPIVCSILALLAFGAGALQKKDWLLRSAGALWIVAFITGAASVMAGHLFAHHLGMMTDWTFLPPHEAMKGQLRFHALLGMTGLTLSLLTLWGASRLLKGSPHPLGFLLAAGLGTAVLFGLAGHEGGEMTYPEESAVMSEEPSAPALSGGPADLLNSVRDYRKNFVRMNKREWNSRTHGHRWVNTYVSPDAVAAYKNSDTIPEGGLIVKESFEDLDNKPSSTPGPLYMMRKGPRADLKRTAGWQYALVWSKPIPGNPENIQGPVTWLQGDSHLNACFKCHSHFKTVDYLGGVPAGFENP